jgi:hypothetical protein
MKTTVILAILVVMGGTAFLDVGPDSICLASKPCLVGRKGFDGPIPVCRPGKPCKSGKGFFDGGPFPICRPNVRVEQLGYLTAIPNRSAALPFPAKLEQRLMAAIRNRSAVLVFLAVTA